MRQRHRAMKTGIDLQRLKDKESEIERERNKDKEIERVKQIESDINTMEEGERNRLRAI